MPTDDTRSDGTADGTASSLTRRRFLATQSLAVAGLAGIGSGVATADGRGRIRNSVSVDPTDRSERPVAETLFGRLQEFYGDDTIYPGVYSLHLKNPTFYRTVDAWAEDWVGDMGAFVDVERDDVLPFPWQPVGSDGVGIEHRTDGEGVAGGQVPDGGVGYPRITVEGGAVGGISQSTVLPDFRTLGYDLALSVRGTVGTVTVAIETPDGETLAAGEAPVSTEWDRHEWSLELDRKSAERHTSPYGAVDTEHVPYGEYVVTFTAEGEGHFDVDFVELAAADAVVGERTGAPFNPTTLQLLEAQHHTWLKWPGGNVTSQYNWEDGIGPLAERTPRFNHAWGGIQPNYFGTAEYLELCELADLTPEITIGWHDNAADWAAEREILPEDAANWLAYVNGSTDTEYGALRAEHGYAEPWGVEHWGVGNEVWGEWQFGHTRDPAEYATGSEERIGFDEYARAMRAVDDSITILASGWDPAEAEHDGTPWNETLLSSLPPELLDGLSVHRYEWGFQDDQAAVVDWKERNDADDWDYNEVLVMAPTQLGERLADLGELAAEHGHEDLYINLSELGIFPTVDEGAPYPGPETMPGGAYIAGALNALIRLSDTVRWAAQTWVPVVMSPEAPNPLRPDGIVTGLYSALFEGDAEWHSLGVAHDGAGRDLPDTGPRVDPATDVPYVDSAAMADGDDRLAVFLSNRNLRAASEVTVTVGREYSGHPVAVVAVEPASGERPLPHAWWASWEAPSNVTVSRSVRTVDRDGTLTLTLDPAGVARLLVSPERGRVASVDDHGVWGGITYPEIPLQQLSDDGGLPRDPDGDGLLEDIDGDGSDTVTIGDVRTLARSLEHATVRDQPALFDFDGDGTVAPGDVVELLDRTE